MFLILLDIRSAFGNFSVLLYHAIKITLSMGSLLLSLRSWLLLHQNQSALWNSVMLCSPRKALVVCILWKKGNIKKLIFTFLLVMDPNNTIQTSYFSASVKGFLHQEICFITKHAGRSIKMEQETLEEHSTDFMLKNCSLYYQKTQKLCTFRNIRLYFEQKVWETASQDLMFPWVCMPFFWNRLYALLLK